MRANTPQNRHSRLRDGLILTLLSAVASPTVCQESTECTLNRPPRFSDPRAPKKEVQTLPAPTVPSCLPEDERAICVATPEASLAHLNKTAQATTVLFVPGVFNTGNTRVESSLALSRLRGLPVYGVLNDTAGAADLINAGAGLISPSLGAKLEEAVDVVSNLIKSAVENGKPLEINAHSQGGIIVANALYKARNSPEFVAWNDSKWLEKTSKIRVRGFGTPQRNFNIANVVLYMHSLDAVPNISLLNQPEVLTLGNDTPIQYIGTLETFKHLKLEPGTKLGPKVEPSIVSIAGKNSTSHSFLSYLEDLPVFVTNELLEGSVQSPRLAANKAAEMLSATTFAPPTIETIITMLSGHFTESGQGEEFNLGLADVLLPATSQDLSKIGISPNMLKQLEALREGAKRAALNKIGKFIDFRELLTNGGVSSSNSLPLPSLFDLQIIRDRLEGMSVPELFEMSAPSKPKSKPLTWISQDMEDYSKKIPTTDVDLNWTSLVSNRKALNIPEFNHRYQDAEDSDHHKKETMARLLRTQDFNISCFKRIDYTYERLEEICKAEAFFHKLQSRVHEALSVCDSAKRLPSANSLSEEQRAFIDISCRGILQELDALLAKRLSICKERLRLGKAEIRSLVRKMGTNIDLGNAHSNSMTSDRQSYQLHININPERVREFEEHFPEEFDRRCKELIEEVANDKEWHDELVARYPRLRQFKYAELTDLKAEVGILRARMQEQSRVIELQARIYEHYKMLKALTSKK